jgi:6-phosphogluconolactonase
MDMVKSLKPNIIKAENNDNLAHEALQQFIDTAQNAIQSKGVFYVAISGGHTPTAFYELLSQESNYTQIDWEHVHLFWVDERCVLPSAEASNFGQAAHAFLLDVPIPGENIHRVSGESHNYEAAAKEYEQVILNVFKIRPGQVPQFDLIILGMGADGHIGSLLPNSTALFETQHLVCTVYRMDQDFSRITLTIPVIQQASKILILIGGRAKAEIVRDVFHSEPDEVKYPVHFLWPNMEKITWIIDCQAASLL